MMDRYVQGPDGQVAVNRRLENLAFATFGIPASECSDLVPPSSPPMPADPPCAPPPPALCGPWEEAEGYNTQFMSADSTLVLRSSIESSFDDCLTTCCDAVADGAKGVVYEPSGRCYVTLENPIMRSPFVETPMDYGTRSTAISAVLLEFDTPDPVRWHA